MDRYALIENDEVQNIVLWDGESQFTPTEGKMVKLPESLPVDIGWSYVKNKFKKPKSEGTQ